jgi:hypothetical protein
VDCVLLVSVRLRTEPNSAFNFKKGAARCDAIAKQETSNCQLVRATISEVLKPVRNVMATGQKENDGEGRRRRRRGELGDATVSSPARWGRWILSLENPSVPQ